MLVSAANFRPGAQPMLELPVTHTPPRVRVVVLTSGPYLAHQRQCQRRPHTASLICPQRILARIILTFVLNRCHPMRTIPKCLTTLASSVIRNHSVIATYAAQIGVILFGKNATLDRAKISAFAQVVSVDGVCSSCQPTRRSQCCRRETISTATAREPFATELCMGIRVRVMALM